MARTLLNVPAKAAKGAVVELKALIAHPMETGYRPDDSGGIRPRDIIQRFSCTYNGEEVFAADLYPAMSANPYLAFTTVATESGELAFHWTDDAGRTQTETAKIAVE